jgi:hypothetical protein
VKVRFEEAPAEFSGFRLLKFRNYRTWALKGVYSNNVSHGRRLHDSCPRGVSMQEHSMSSSCKQFYTTSSPFFNLKWYFELLHVFKMQKRWPLISRTSGCVAK